MKDAWLESVLFTVAALGAASYAQFAVVSFSGRIVDPNGAALSGAVMTVQSQTGSVEQPMRI